MSVPSGGGGEQCQYPQEVGVSSVTPSGGEGWVVSPPSGGEG